MLFLSLYRTVPSPVNGLTVSRERHRKLNISWEPPEEPNDYTSNYTVTIIDISTGSEWNKTVVDMNQLSVLAQVLGMNIIFTLIMTCIHHLSNTTHYLKNTILTLVYPPM